jgi:hypothetical protein
MVALEHTGPKACRPTAGVADTTEERIVAMALHTQPSSMVERSEPLLSSSSLDTSP